MKLLRHLFLFKIFRVDNSTAAPLKECRSNYPLCKECFVFNKRHNIVISNVVQRNLFLEMFNWVSFLYTNESRIHDIP